ncbi:TetR/AcrR family transcriptional regulator [Brucella endophytica]
MKPADKPAAMALRAFDSCTQAGMPFTRPGSGQCMKRNTILDAAARAFCRDGFAGASIDLIAAEAGVSRQTIYNHYRDKEMLFGAVVGEITARVNAALCAILSTFPEKPDNLEADLVLFANKLGKKCMCNQDGEALRKLIQAEGERYPELFAVWRENGPARVWSIAAERLASLSACGALDIDDPDLALRQFLALVNADIQLCGLTTKRPTEKDIEDAARNGVRTFLRAFGRSSASCACRRTGACRGAETF